MEEKLTACMFVQSQFSSEITQNISQEKMVVHELLN